MSLLTASPFLRALGWALLNSVWQFAICWFFYRALITGIKTLSAAARHTIAICFLFAGTAFFIAGFLWKYYSMPASSAIIIENTAYYNTWHAADRLMDVIMPYWSLLYLFWVGLLCVKFYLFVRRTGNLQNNGHTKMNAVWRTYVNNIAAQLGIRKEVKALLSVHIDTPQVMGFLKPVILIPAACLNNLTTEQLEAVLLHELVHVKRNDYLVNLFVASLEILFFFNPFVKQITSSIRKEREYSCDDMVMQFRYAPHNYAAALLTLEKNRLSPITYGIAANGKNQKQLLTRVERIVGIKNNQPGLYQMAACILALFLLGFIAAINPAKVAIHQLGSGAFNLAGNNITGLQYNEEEPALIKNNLALAGPVEKNDRPIVADLVIAPIKNIAVKKIKTCKEQINRAVPAPEAYAINAIQLVADKQDIDFSLPQKEITAMPETPGFSATAEPYVPGNSFSYHVTQDTARIKLKGATYNEREARLAMVKAQKAMAALNWQKIEKQLKSSPQVLAKLKREIALQLKNLNWQQINNDVQAQLKSDQLQQVQQVYQQDEIIRQYQQNASYYEALQRQLTEQEQLIKENELRDQQMQKTLEQKAKSLQAELKKKKIIYL